MLRRMLGCVVLLVLVILPGVSTGQVMLPGKWWRVAHISDRLDLSETEKAQLDELFFQNRRKLLQYKRTLEKEQSNLQTMLERDPLDEGLVTETLRKLEEARTNLADERFRFILEVRKLLGRDRFLRLKEVFKEVLEKKSSPNRLRGEPKKRSWLHFW